MSGGIWGCHDRGARDDAGVEWVGARDTAKHPIIRRAAPITKNCPAQNVNNADAENLGVEILFCVCFRIL